jgi:flagellar motor switch protein FliG
MSTMTKSPIQTMGARKAAVLLVQLGKTQAAKVLSMLDEHEVEAITAEIAMLDSVSLAES